MTANLPFPHFSGREKQSILIENMTFKQEKSKNYYTMYRMENLQFYIVTNKYT